MARPRKKTDQQLITDVDDYLDYCYECRENDDMINGIPQVIAFAKRNGLSRTTIYERSAQCPELSNAIKGIIAEKELVLETYALANKINHTMAIFSLKQLGWKDKVEEQISHEIKVNIPESVSDYAD